MLFYSGIQYDEDVVSTILTLQNQLLTEVVTEAKAICHHQGKRTIQPEHMTFACNVSKRRARRKFSRLSASNLKKLAEHIDAKGWPEPSKKPSALRLPSLQNCLAQPTYVIKHDLHVEDVRRKLADPTRGEKRHLEPVPRPFGDLASARSGPTTFQNLPVLSSTIPINPSVLEAHKLALNTHAALASNNAVRVGGSLMSYTSFGSSIQSQAPSLPTFALPQQSIASVGGEGSRFPRMPLMSTRQQQVHTMPGSSLPAANFSLPTSNAGSWTIPMMQQSGAIPVRQQLPPMAQQHMQLQYVSQQGGNLHTFPPQPLNQSYYLVPGPVQGTVIVQSGPMPLGTDPNMVMPSMVGQPSPMTGNVYRAANSLPAGFTRQNSREFLPINVSNHSVTSNNNQVPVSVVAAAAVSVASNPTQDVNLDNIF